MADLLELGKRANRIDGPIQLVYREAVASVSDTRYALAAMLALQLYEWLVLLDTEIYLIHKSRLSMINISYIFCRYYPALLWVFFMWGIVGNHTSELCLRVTKPIHALLAPCQFISQGVMMMRAYAFTARNRRVLILLSVCYTLLISINIWVFCVGVVVPVRLYTLMGPTGCVAHLGKRVGYAIVATTLMDLVSFAVVCVHCYKSRVREVSLGRYFVNQGLVAFAFICAVNLVCAVLWFKPPMFSNALGIPLILVMPNLVACRVILGLRQHCQPPSLSELSAQTSRIVRDAFEQRHPDAWTIK